MKKSDKNNKEEGNEGYGDNKKEVDEDCINSNNDYGNLHEKQEEATDKAFTNEADDEDSHDDN